MSGLNSLPIIIGAYAISSSSSSLGVKTASVTRGGFTLKIGTIINVIFDNKNTSSSIKLNINNTGDKPIASEDGVIVSSSNPLYFTAGCIVEFVYDGLYWRYKNKVITNYKNGNFWYRKYTNGWVEQGDSGLSVAHGAIVTLPTPFLTSNYTIVGNPDTTVSEGYVAFYSKTSTNFRYKGSLAIVPFSWMACGF